MMINLIINKLLGIEKYTYYGHLKQKSKHYKLKHDKASDIS